MGVDESTPYNRGSTTPYNRPLVSVVSGIQRKVMKQSWSVFGSLNHFDLTFFSLMKTTSTVAFGLQIWSILHHPSFSYALTSKRFFLSFIPAINAFLRASCSAWRLKHALTKIFTLSLRFYCKNETKF